MHINTISSCFVLKIYFLKTSVLEFSSQICLTIQTTVLLAPKLKKVSISLQNFSIKSNKEFHISSKLQR